MSWYINDLSLSGQFQTNDEFLELLASLLHLRSRNDALSGRLFCSRLLSGRPVVNQLTLQQVVQNCHRTDLKRIILIWLNKNGPFCDDFRQDMVDDCFEMHDTDVTDNAMGEAIRQQIAGQKVAAFSFEGAVPNSSYSPLKVVQLKDNASIAEHEIENIWRLEELDNISRVVANTACDWSQILTSARDSFDGLKISRNIDECLSRQPFNSVIAKRITELLNILDMFVKSRSDKREYTDQTNSIVRDHFSGDGLFSDESNTNKRAFRGKLTFFDAELGAEPLFCPWHGKISHRYFRIHFQYPITAQDRFIKVFYIGPKLTKS